MSLASAITILGKILLRMPNHIFVMPLFLNILHKILQIS